VTKQTLRREQSKRSERAARGATLERWRTIDWLRSPLGAWEEWPAALRVAATLCLNAPTPMLLCARREFALVYNEASMHLLAGSPSPPGQPADRVWPEHWDAFAPLFSSVFDTGEAVKADNIQLLAARDGDVEDRYVAIVVTPVSDDAGNVLAALAILTDLAEGLRPALLADVRAQVSEAVSLFEEGFQIVDAEWRYTFVNNAAVAILGRSREALLGVSLWELFPNVDPETKDRLLQVMERRESASFELYYPTSRRWFHVVAYPAGSGIAIRYADITNHKRADEERRAQEMHFQLVTDALPVLISYVDRDYTYRFANRCYEQWFGFTPDQFVGQKMADVVGDAAFENIQPLLDRALAGETITDEAWMPYRRGGRRFIRFSYVPDRTPSGDVRGVFALAQDLTDRKRAEDEQQAQQKRLELLSDAMPGLVAYVDRDEKYRFVNRRHEEWFGYPSEHYLGRSVADVVGAETYDRLRPFIAQALAGETVSYDLRMLVNGGAERFVYVSYTPDKDESGNVHGYYSLIQDITERKRSEQALTESEERFRRLADTAPVLIWMTDEHKNSTYFNKRWLEFTGESEQQALTSDWTQAVHPDDRPMLGRCANAFDARTPFTMDFRFQRADGEYRWMHDAALPRYDADGTFRGFIGTMIDITERKQLEQERAETLEAERLARSEAEMLRDLGVAVNSELEVSALVQRVTDVATSVVGAEFGAFFYNAIDADGESYSLYTLSGAPREAFAKFPMPRNTAVFAPTFDGAAVVRSADITQDPRYGKNAPHAGMPAGHLPVKSYLAVPVRARSGEVLGGLFFGHAQPDRFQERHERLIVGIAAQAAVAMDNARLFEMVREQAARWQATYDKAGIGICEATLDGRFLGSNEKFREIVGYSTEEILRLRFQDITHPDDVAADEELYRDLQLGKIGSYTLEKRYIRKDGNRVWVRMTVSLTRDANGNPRYCIAAVEDITETRRAETVIMGQKRALEQIARGEALPQVLETLVNTFNRQSIFGGLAQILLFDLDGRSCSSIDGGRLPKEWVDAVRRLGAHAYLPVHPVGTAPHAIALERDPRWAPAQALAAKLGLRTLMSLPIYTSQNELLGAFGIFYRELPAVSDDELRYLDIVIDTAAIAIGRHHAEKSLRLQAQVLSHIHDAVVMTDRKGTITRWNEGARRVFGYTAEEAIGKHVSLCYFPEDHATIEGRIMRPLIREGRFELLARLRRRSGEALYGHVSLSLLQSESGKRNAVVAYILDMTERVRAEEEIGVRVRQQDAVAHVGQLALSNMELPALMNEIARQVAMTLDVEFVKILERLPDDRGLLLRAGTGWRDGLVGTAVLSAGLESQGGYSLAASSPVIVADLRRETRFRAATLLRDHQVISGMTVIIPGERDQPYGVLGAHSKRERQFSVHDINFLQSIANVLAAAIQRRQVEQMLASARDDLERRVEERTAELARANQSLRDEIVERMGVEGALRESEAQYRMLFERNPLSAWVFDINSRQIMAANETAVWQYGYTREEFLRMTIDDLHPRDEGTRVLDYAEQFPPETAYIGVWKHCKQDETVIDVEIFVYEVLFQGRWARLVLANDITERRRAEQEFRLLESITRAVSEARDLETALYAVVRHICETTGWAVGEAWLPGSGPDRLVCSRAGYSIDSVFDAFRREAWQQELQTGQGLIGRAWSVKHPVWVPDVTIDDGFGRATLARDAGVRAGTAFPVLAEGEIVALLAFFLREPRREDERLVKLVSTIAAQLGLAIQRKRAEELLRKSELQLSEAQHLAHLGSWEWDVTTGTIKWSDELYRIYGIESGAPITYGDYLARIHPDDRERVKQEHLRALRTRDPLSGEERVVRTNGEVRHLLTQNAVVTDELGQSVRMVGVCLDITDRKRAEERLRDYAHRLQNLSTRLLEAQETERRRIARELHDQIGQDLSVIKINLQALKRLPAETIIPQVDETIRVVEGVLSTARNLSLELRPSMLDDLGLAAALRWYLDRQSQRAGFTLHFDADNVDGRVASTIETACFRLAQEALTNIIRHAHASHVHVGLALQADELRMRIEDDGRGFDVEAARARAARGDSFGLLGMEERALLAGGTIEIISSIGRGTTIIARFPLKTALSS
jgi:PAS domain S-box-containing protein